MASAASFSGALDTGDSVAGVGDWADWSDDDAFGVQPSIFAAADGTSHVVSPAEDPLNPDPPTAVGFYTTPGRH